MVRAARSADTEVFYMAGRQLAALGQAFWRPDAARSRDRGGACQRPGQGERCGHRVFSAQLNTATCLHYQA